MPAFLIDPRDWILPPYIVCPVCGEEEYGVLMITGRGYVRRCRACHCSRGRWYLGVGVSARAWCHGLREPSARQARAMTQQSP